MARGSQGLPGTAALRAAGWGRGYLATPSPRLSPWASLSFVVRRRPSLQSGPSPPPRTSLLLRCRPPFARSAPSPEPRRSPSLPVSGPLLLPTPSSLPDPSTSTLNVGVCVSVSQTGVSGHRRRSWDGSPLSPALQGPAAAAGRRREPCSPSEWLLLAAPFASREGLGPQLPCPPSPAQTQTAGNWQRPQAGSL